MSSTPAGLPLKPVIGLVPEKAPRPKTGKVPQKKRWRFSLRFWRQPEFFGVGTCDPSWFVSLLERLADMSQMEIDEFLENRAAKAAVRFHPIDWNAKSIPISQSDINWLGDDYSSSEFEFVQFHVSKALGRIVGFFDEENTFQIVLCDPLHNIQPAGDFGYRVRATMVGECHLTQMSLRFADIVNNSPHMDDVQKQEMLAGLRANAQPYFQATVLLSISDNHLATAHTLCGSGIVSHLGDLLEAAIEDYAKYIQ